MSEVLILGEVKAGSLDTRTLELLGAGKKLAQEMGGEFSLLLMGADISGVADQAPAYGPARIYKVEHPLLEGFKPDIWVAVLEQACRKIHPKVLLMSHSFVGMEVAPRLSARLNSRLTTDCIDLAMEDGLLLRTKPVSGGNAIAVFKFQGEPQLATVRGKVFPAQEPAEGTGEIQSITPELDETMIRVTSLEIVKEDSVALDKAGVVVAGGAGLGEEDGFELLEELAEALGNSFDNVMIGCSRVAVDKGWISSDHQVGLTGTLISPDIYIAVGISGAIQHLVGMVHAKKIIAINTDKSCNMFKVADYGIVEDYEDVIPALIEKLEELS